VVCNHVNAQTVEYYLHRKLLLGPQIKVGQYPIDIEANEDTNKIYVTNYQSGSVSVIDSDSGHTKNIRVGVKPKSIAIDDRSDSAYVANLGSGYVSVIDGYNDSKIKKIDVGKAPLNILYDDFSKNYEDAPRIYNKIYVTNSASSPGSVSVINGTTYTKEAKDIQVGKLPSAIAIDAHANVIYVTNRNSNKVTAINGTTDRPIMNITVGISPFAITVDYNNNKIYVVNQGSNNVTVINGRTYKTEALIPVRKEPWAIAIDAHTNVIYVTNRGNKTVTAINGSTDKVIRNIKVGKSPTDIAVDSKDDKIYVANIDNKTVSVINGSTYKKTDISVGSNPFRIAYDSRTNMIYVVNRGSDSVSVIDASSDKVAAGVIFNVNPSDSGTIMCDNQSGTNQIEYPINVYIYVDNGTRCTGQGKDNYGFDRWVQNLSQNSSLTINDPSGKALTYLTVDLYGNFTAYFKPHPPTISPEYLYLIISVIISSLIGWSIPTIYGWAHARTQRKHLKECIKQIGKIGKNAIEEKVIGYYVDGKISEDHREFLKDKISEYYDRSSR
jgi:YVTN family beta-propeller protein